MPAVSIWFGSNGEKESPEPDPSADSLPVIFHSWNGPRVVVDESSKI